MVNSTAFAKRLEIILTFYGISATAFSEEIDFNRSTISHLLSGRNKPSLDFVMKVVQKFPEVELYWLLNGKGSFPSQKEKENSITEDAALKQTQFSKKAVIPLEKSFQELPVDKTLEKDTTTSEIDKIVIFYKDGSFKAYNN